MPDKVERTHTYHAEATVLHGDLHHPLVQEIKPQTNVKLSPKGGYLSEHSEPYRLEGVISFRKAYTQTGGNPNPKPCGGWSTLCTSVIEDLNVLEVVTADRVVGQIAADYPKEGYVPSITFLGTRFENLRIAGHPVDIDIHPNPCFLGEKPENDGSYTRHPGFLERMTQQFERIRGGNDFPPEVLDRYKLPVSNSDDKEQIVCSLVNKVEGPYPGRSFGHVIHVPGFGYIHLAVLRIEHSDFCEGVPKKTLLDLTMIQLEMGCLAGGTSGLGSTVVNGGTAP